jgi:hypothetical protein
MTVRQTRATIADLRCLGQFLVLHLLGLNEPNHGIPKQVRIVTVVEPPRHLIKAGLQVLRAGLVPRTNDTALEQARGRWPSP